ncbi:MAG: hypothetical protein ACR2RV_24440 [Verrucomicrobiales bacterium]
MRLVTITIPAVLLGGLALLSKSDRSADPQPPAPPGEPALAAESPHGSGGPSIVWLSHDWIELPPEETKSDESRRRMTFGLDRERPVAECFDPNCRACLIDSVYGREF